MDLQVDVEEADVLAAGHPDAVAHRAAAALVGLVQDHLPGLARGLPEPLDYVARAVGAGVVDEDELVPVPGLSHHRVDLGDALLEVRALVVGGDDDGDVGVGRHAVPWRSARGRLPV